MYVKINDAIASHNFRYIIIVFHLREVRMMKVNDEDCPLFLALVDHLVLEAVIKHQHLSLSPGQVPLIIHLWSYSGVNMSQVT